MGEAVGYDRKFRLVVDQEKRQLKQEYITER